MGETGHSIGTPDGAGTNFALGDDVDTVEVHGPDGSSTLQYSKNVLSTAFWLLW